MTITASLAAITLSGTIYNDLHLHNIFTNPAEIDYILDGSVDVYADLTIDPGVNIRVDNGGGLDIYGTGSISAVGKADSMITFVGSSATRGNWDGIWIVSNNNANELTYVDVAHAGANGYADVYVAASGRVKITNSVLRESATYGLYMDWDANLTSFTGNDLRSNGLAPAHIPARVIGALDATSVYSDGNGNNHIRRGRREVVSASATWRKLDVPYSVSGGIDVEAAVTVEAGAQFLFSADASLDVYSNGSLHAVGTAVDTIVFRRSGCHAGLLAGRLGRVEQPAQRAYLREGLHGGADGYADVYVVGDCQVAITHSVLERSETYGLQVTQDGILANHAANTYRGNTLGPVHIPADVIGSLDAASEYGADTDASVHVFACVDRDRSDMAGHRRSLPGGRLRLGCGRCDRASGRLVPVLVRRQPGCLSGGITERSRHRGSADPVPGRRRERQATGRASGSRRTTP